MMNKEVFGRGDQIFSLTMLVKNDLEKGRKLLPAVMDLEEACDSIDGKSLWEILRIYKAFWGEGVSVPFSAVLELGTGCHIHYPLSRGNIKKW